MICAFSEWPDRMRVAPASQSNRSRTIDGNRIGRRSGQTQEFKSGRELAAYLGLVPGHRASGGHTVMLGISKRGDRYMRTLLVNRARAAVYASERTRDALSIWVSRLKLRRERTWPWLWPYKNVRVVETSDQ
jgi:transposase